MAARQRDGIRIGEATLRRGHGGELHQIADEGAEVLTTNQGIPVADDQNSLRLGERGPTLLEDFHFREKLFHFDHERIPERVVHARGYGAHGFFETYDSLSDVTRADLFQRKGERTEVFVRFSTVAGSEGSADLARDVRGFAVKFYTKEGNWDLVGNNIPVFFIQDAIKFPDLIHAAKPEPDRAFPQAQTAHDNFWDFISLTPESMHMVMWIMSDRTIPRSFRFMEGFGVHTFRFVNADGKSTFVKFHWKPKQGLQSVVWNEAVKLNGADPDFHRRDLWDAIQLGDYPEWELGLQVIEPTDEFAFDFDLLDATKIIPEELVPVRRVGRLVLNDPRAFASLPVTELAERLQHVERRVRADGEAVGVGHRHGVEARLVRGQIGETQRRVRRARQVRARKAPLVTHRPCANGGDGECHIRAGLHELVRRLRGEHGDALRVERHGLALVPEQVHRVQHDVRERLGDGHAAVPHAADKIGNHRRRDCRGSWPFRCRTNQSLPHRRNTGSHRPLATTRSMAQSQAQIGRAHV